jgi:tetratricopeptide (TPR) repeat protein
MSLRVCDAPELSRLDPIDPGDHHEKKGGRQKFEMISVSTLSPKIAMENDALAGSLDFVSLDTEGGELKILIDMLDNGANPSVITVEHNFTPMQHEIDSVLSERGYVRVLRTLSSFDGWYLRRDIFEARLLDGGRTATMWAPPRIPETWPQPASGARNEQLKFALLLGNMGEKTKAIALSDTLQPLIKHRQDWLSNRLSLSDSHNNETQASGALWVELAQLDRENRQAAVRASDWLVAQGQDERAIDILSHCSPGWPTLLRRRGECETRLGRYDQASDTYELLSESHPDRPDGILGQARVCLANGDAEAACDLLRENAEKWGDHQEFAHLFRHYLIRSRKAQGNRGFPIAWNDYEGRTALAIEGKSKIPCKSIVENGGQPDPQDADWQVMYNGVRVPIDGYYGPWMSDLISRCDGQHEPQAEPVFEAVLDTIQIDPKRDLVMIELGAFWAFYTTTFLRRFMNHSQALVIEPDAGSLATGLATLQYNDVKADPILGRIGPSETPTYKTRFGAELKAPQIDLLSLLRDRNIDQIDILHADIQGAEISLMDEISTWLTDQKINYLFIYTHGLKEHLHVLNALNTAKYIIIAEHDTFESYAFNGLIVARAQTTNGPAFMNIPRRGVD